jgi:hypothetical protein
LAIAAHVVLVLASFGSPTVARDLTFEERVEAQEAIERVYYSHQLGTTKPFEDAVPRAVIEQKVTTYLKKSVALDTEWHTPVTAELLHRELERIARETRFPDRLKEIYAALGNDAFLLEECFARAVVVDRLATMFGRSDTDSLPSGSSSASEFDPSACAADGTWDNGVLDDTPPSGRDGTEGVWTGTELIVWGGGASTVVRQRSPVRSTGRSLAARESAGSAFAAALSRVRLDGDSRAGLGRRRFPRGESW